MGIIMMSSNAQATRRLLCMLSKCSTTEPHLQPFRQYLMSNI